MAVANRTRVESTTYHWNVKYPFLVTDCNICSTGFSIDSYGVTGCYLNFVCHKTDEENYNVSLFLKKHEWNFDARAIIMNLKIYIHNYNINEYYTLDNVSSENDSEIIFEKEISVTNITDVSIQSEIKFNLEIETKIDFEEIGDVWAWNYDDLETLSSDIGNSLDNKKFADLTLKSIDDKAERVHKTIFASRYSTLAESLDMFQNPEQEYVLELSGEGMSHLLHYLYSGKIKVTLSSCELLELLNKTQLFHLEHILYSEPRILHATTSVPLKYGSFVLIIPKFSELQNDTYLVNYLCCDTSSEWARLIVCFYIRESTPGERYLTFRIQRVEQSGNLFGSCKISIIAEEEDNDSYHLNFKSQGEPILLSFLKVEQVRQKSDCFLINDTLKVHFEVILSNLEVMSHYDSVECLDVQREQFPSTAMNLWALRKDIAHLYLNSQFADMTIQTGASLIPAHKVILSARSPFFAQILEREVERKCVLIDKYDERIVLDILSYIYSGEIKTEPESYEYAIDLYVAAKEYKIKKLQKKCFNYIKDNLNVGDNISKLMEKFRKRTSSL